MNLATLLEMTYALSLLESWWLLNHLSCAPVNVWAELRGRVAAMRFRRLFPYVEEVVVLSIYAPADSRAKRRVFLEILGTT